MLWQGVRWSQDQLSPRPHSSGGTHKWGGHWLMTQAWLHAPCHHSQSPHSTHILQQAASYHQQYTYSCYGSVLACSWSLALWLLTSCYC
jgi:hypothetical protein